MLYAGSSGHTERKRRLAPKADSLKIDRSKEQKKTKGKRNVGKWEGKKRRLGKA